MVINDASNLKQHQYHKTQSIKLSPGSPNASAHSIQAFSDAYLRLRSNIFRSKVIISSSYRPGNPHCFKGDTYPNVVISKGGCLSAIMPRSWWASRICESLPGSRFGDTREGTVWDGVQGKHFSVSERGGPLGVRFLILGSRWTNRFCARNRLVRFPISIVQFLFNCHVRSPGAQSRPKFCGLSIPLEYWAVVYSLW